MTSLQISEKNPLKRMGGVLDQYNSMPLFVKNTPQSGDVFIMDFKNGTRQAGFVEKIVENTIYTIEGNTNDSGELKGYKVTRRKT